MDRHQCSRYLAIVQQAHYTLTRLVRAPYPPIPDISNRFLTILHIEWFVHKRKYDSLDWFQPHWVESLRLLQRSSWYFTLGEAPIFAKSIEFSVRIPGLLLLLVLYSQMRRNAQLTVISTSEVNVTPHFSLVRVVNITHTRLFNTMGTPSKTGTKNKFVPGIAAENFRVSWNLHK